MKALQFIVVLITVIFFSNLTFSTEYITKKKDELKKIEEDLKNIKRLLDDDILPQETYENSRRKLLERKQKLLDKDKPKKTNKKKKRTTQLEKELEVIKKLFDDGLLTKDEYEKTRDLLIDKDETREEKKLSKLKPYELNILSKEGDKKNWEKTEILYGNYRIYTYRPGGIKVVRISDEKKLAQITDNLKVKYFNNGQNVVSAKINKKGRPTIFETLDKSLDQDSEEYVLKTLGKKKEKSTHNPDDNKLELFIEGDKILHIEGRYNKKYHAMFYQVLTRDFQSFHFYISLSGKAPIALNMGMFNTKIDKAVRKAKEKIAEEFDVSMEEIDRIIEEKLGESIEDTINQNVEEAVSASVAAAIEQTVGQVMADTLVSAIEEATGEAIEQSLEDELAAAIDAEIAYAVSIGIEEAAVTAGWEAYFDVLAQGGTVEEASAAAYKACGSACDNY
tara:strand:- start:197 stop:1543 length:1347 start_codon:yes stop_codon:yes gene_type:complete